MRLLGVLEMIAVTAIWGSVPIIAIWSGLPSPAFVFFRVSIAFLALLTLLRELDARLLAHRLVLALNWIALFHAVQLIPVAEAVLLYYVGPIIAIIAMHLLGEVGVGGNTGVAIIIRPANLSGGPGTAVALASGVLYGLLIAANKLAVRSI